MQAAPIQAQAQWSLDVDSSASDEATFVSEAATFGGEQSRGREGADGVYVATNVRAIDAASEEDSEVVLEP